jgi:hypothetical protein
MHPILIDFIRDFRASFSPPRPYRGKAGQSWLVSRVWTERMKDWLTDHYQVTFELPIPERRRLDAALWCRDTNQKKDQIDIAVEWEWDNNKVDKDFLCGDFRKLFEVEAKCGLALVQTRVDGSRGMAQAERIIKNLQGCYVDLREASESIAVIEVRRVANERSRVNFICTAYDLDDSSTEEVARWSFA